MKKLENISFRLKTNLFIICLLCMQSFFMSSFLFAQDINVALGKSITSNGHVYDFGAWNANDGNAGTYWEGNSSGSDILTVNLGEVVTVSQVVLKLNPDYSWASRTQTLSVLGSTDGAAFGILKEQAVYSFDPATGNQVSIPLSGSARFVRLDISDNSSGWSGQIAEFEVWGSGGTEQRGTFGNNGNNWQINGICRIEAENYDTGGEGVAYFDGTAGNTGGVYRQDDVDIQVCTDDNGGYNAGWLNSGDWMEYTVDVTGGEYDIIARVASAGGVIGDLSILIDGVQLGIFPVENSGGWQQYTDVVLKNVQLPGGSDKFLRLESVNGGDFNVNYIEFVPVSTDLYSLSVENGFGTALGGGLYAEGARVEIKARLPQPDNGTSRIFDYWTGDIGFLDNPDMENTTLTMPDFDISLEAVSHIEYLYTYQLTVVQGSGSGEYAAGKVVPVHFIYPEPTAGFNTKFMGWQGDGLVYLADKSAADTTITMPVSPIPNDEITITGTYEFVEIPPLVKYEAEKALLGGSARIENEHAGFSDSGYVGGFWNAGGNPSVTFTVTVEADHYYDLTLGYGNGMGNERTLSIYVDGVEKKQTALPNLGMWQVWAQKKEMLFLTAGTHQIMYKFDDDDTGNVNLDYINVEPTVEKVPDLVITDVSTGTDDPVEGEIIFFEAAVQNRGTGNLTDSVDVVFYVDGKEVSRSAGVSFLAENGTVMVEANNSWIAVPGEHVISAVVDLSGKAAEIDEDNNSYEKTVIITRTPGVDLVIKNVIYEPSNIQLNDRVTFKVLVENEGITDSDYTEHGVNLSVNGGPSMSGSLTTSIKAGGSALIGVNGSWTALENGSFPFSAAVDQANNIKETHEENNFYNGELFIGRGAKVPWIEYEAEAGTTNAEITAPGRELGTLSGEASGRQAVVLKNDGDYVEWTTSKESNSIVIRYSIPDAPGGGGIDAPLSIYVDGEHKTDIPLTSEHAYVYGGDTVASQSDSPASGPARRIYDESHMLFDFTIPAGAVLKLQKDSGDFADFYGIDLVDLEMVGGPIPMPEGYISITDPNQNWAPAVPDDGISDQMAIAQCIRAVESGQYAGVYIPVGNFEHEQKLMVNGVIIQGAGMWYSRLYNDSRQITEGWGDTGFNITGDNCEFRDFMLEGWTNGLRGGGGKAWVNSARKNMVIDNMWVEHVVCGYWVGGPQESTNLQVTNSRFRNTGADAINLCNGNLNSRIYNCTARNTGDDAFAIWSATDLYAQPNINNVIENCTVQLPWRAAAYAVYGGRNNRVINSVAYDTMTYPGIQVSTEFKPYAMEGALVDGLTLIRCGGGYWQDAKNGGQQQYGAVWVFAEQDPYDNVVFKNIDIIDPTYSGILFQSRNGSVNNALFENVNIQGAGTYGIHVLGHDPWLYPQGGGTKGSASFTGLSITNSGLEDIFNDSADFTLDIEESPEHALTVVNGTGDGNYNTGAVVTVTANYEQDVPAMYRAVFVNWSGPVNNAASAVTTVTMPAGDVTVTANFKLEKLDPYELIVMNGTGTGTYYPGDRVNITAGYAGDVPEGYRAKFTGWTGPVNDPASPSTYLLMPSGNISVSANFDIVLIETAHRLTVNAGSGSGEYYEGDPVLVEAEYPRPPEGFKTRFTEWTGNGAAYLENRYSAITTLTMPAMNLSITAHFVFDEINDPDPVHFEAENALLGGTAQVESEHAGYSGSGYVGGFWNAGGNPSVTFNVTIEMDAFYDVSLGYANGMGSERTLSIYVDGIDNMQTALPNLGAWAAYGEKKEVLFLTAGAHQIMYKFDSADSGNVNLDYVDLQISDYQAADLVVTDILYSPANPVEGENVYFTAVIKNQATGATGTENHAVEFTVGSRTISSIPLNISLAPGVAAEVTASAAWIGEAGSVPVSALVDPENLINEYDEGNNSYSEIVEVERLPGPDLVVTGIQFSPENPSTGQAVTFSAEITNNGIDASPSSNARVGFALNGGPIAYYGTFGSVPAGGTITVTANSGTWPAVGDSASVIATVDYQNVISETNENNNSFTKIISLGRGAAMPYTRYESEEAELGGSASLRTAYDFDKTKTASEASNQAYVTLPSNGSYVEWNVSTTGDGVTMRFTMPDSSDGMGLDGSLDCYVNGSFVKTVELSSFWMYQYFQADQPQDTPGSEDVRFRFDEVHWILPSPLNPGDTIRIQSSGGLEYGIDFLEIEDVPAIITKPAGAYSVTDFGAVANDGNDDLAAFVACVDASIEDKKTMYIPAGTFHLNDMWVLASVENPFDELTITGAGMWHTNIQFTNPDAYGGGISVRASERGTLNFSNVYMNSMLRSRYNQMAVYKGFMDNLGHNSVIDSVWVEHFECGYWIGDYAHTPARPAQNLVISNGRIRNNLADGVNFCQGTSNSVVENCSVRNNGDDGLAVWPDATMGAVMGVGNIFRYNTIENNWRAAGIAFFGGDLHEAHNNLIRDCFAGAGIRLNGTFPGYHFQNTTAINIYENTIINGGTSDDCYGAERGAIDLASSGGNTIQNIFFDDNDIIDAQRHGIEFTEHGGFQNVVFRNTTINGTGLDPYTTSYFTQPNDGGYAIAALTSNGTVTFENLVLENIETAEPFWTLPGFNLIIR